MFGKTSWVLKGVRGAHAHAIYVLDASVILGRSADAHIQILDQRVSRQHARLTVSETEVLLEDLGSHNGTYIHGLKIARRPLRIGDRIRVGVSEYVLDQIKGRVLTSAIFLNKLNNKDTMGSTAVTKRATQELLSSPTADMPAVRSSREIAARLEDDPSSLPPRPSHAPRTPREATPPKGNEPSYVTEQKARAVRVPTPLPGELTWRPMTAPKPQAAPASVLPPNAGAPLEQPATPDPFVNEMLETATIPLDPRNQRMPTPIPSSLRPIRPPETPSKSQPRVPEQPDDDPAIEAAMRTIDAVVRLLKLRAQETGGAPIKIQDREALRKLEGVLRESRRNRENRRRWTRLPVRLPAHVGKEEIDARVADISAGGMRVTGGTFGLAPGDMAIVRVHLGEGRFARVAVFKTKIAWVDESNQSFGAVFSGPAHWELVS